MKNLPPLKFPWWPLDGAVSVFFCTYLAFSNIFIYLLTDRHDSLTSVSSFQEQLFLKTLYKSPVQDHFEINYFRLPAGQLKMVIQQ